MKVRFFKTIFLSALSTLIAFSAVTYTSCTPDKCKSVVCANGGVCNNGACLCASGYEGAQCEAVTRDKFTGNWNVSETSSLTLANSKYVVAMTDDGGNVSHVNMGNFYNYFTSVNAYVKGDTMYINQQTVNNHVIQGFGVITAQDGSFNQHARMLVYYTVRDISTGETDDYGVNNGSPSVWNK